MQKIGNWLHDMFRTSNERIGKEIENMNYDGFLKSIKTVILIPLGREKNLCWVLVGDSSSTRRIGVRLRIR